MLILTRNIGQSIFIDKQQIKITVEEVQGSQVRLSIDAPSHIDIWREELLIKQLTSKKEEV